MNTTDLLSQDMGTDNLLATSKVATPNSVTPKILSPCLEAGARAKREDGECCTGNIHIARTSLSYRALLFYDHMNN